ncbi:hypothetical protein CSKR_102433 [Clonorchis sinensis]|uniref:Uncharacterized protein n=1 Tax=Clonorchis sinensis TaxID=79923 RepID=A0A419QF22_CLOSI|nr:hypothetical protein CSKR_102433 [Clonorchis sinensis]
MVHQTSSIDISKWEWRNLFGFISIIIDSMTSVFNTDASLPYNHDLFESLTVKERMKMDVEGTYVSNQAHWGSHGPRPERRVAPTTAKRFVISFIPFCPSGQGLATSLLPPL